MAVRRQGGAAVPSSIVRLLLHSVHQIELIGKRVPRPAQSSPLWRECAHAVDSGPCRIAYGSVASRVRAPAKEGPMGEMEDRGYVRMSDPGASFAFHTDAGGTSWVNLR